MGILTFYDKFSRRIGSLLEGDFTDAFLLVEGVEIPVHRCILAAHSEYFKHLFSPKEDSRKTSYQRVAGSDSQALDEIGDIPPTNHQSIVEISNADNVIDLKNAKVEVVRAVLDYFYKGQYDYHENVENHLLALELAHQFKLRDLEETLLENLVESICKENFFQLYNMKMRYKSEKLENSCVCFLKENGEEIVKSDSFTKLTGVSLLSLLDEECFAAGEMDIFRAAERWAGVNKPNKKTVTDIVQKIRLATISTVDLFDVVSKSKELPSIDIMEAIRSITKKDVASTNFRQQQRIPVADLNVAQSSMGAEVLSGRVIGASLISGSSGCTFHKVGGKPECIAVRLDQIYRCYKYHVEVSVNGRKWQRVVDHSNYCCRSHQFLRFDPRAVRFIKITGTDGELKVQSLEARYTNKECSLVQGIPVASTNVVLNSRGAAVTGGYDPMHCIDGTEDSWAVVIENSPLTIKLGQPYLLSSLRLRIDTYDNSYTIESSSDGESWQPVACETKGVEGVMWRIFKFSRRVVLHFRVTMKRKNSPNSGGVSLHHFESPASTLAVTN